MYQIKYQVGIRIRCNTTWNRGRLDPMIGEHSRKVMKNSRSFTTKISSRRSLLNHSDSLRLCPFRSAAYWFFERTNLDRKTAFLAFLLRLRIRPRTQCCFVIAPARALFLLSPRLPLLRSDALTAPLQVSSSLSAPKIVQSLIIENDGRKSVDRFSMRHYRAFHRFLSQSLWRNA